MRSPVPPLCMVVLAAVLATGSASAVPTARPAVVADRAAVERMLFETGYSGIATMRLSHARWIGQGAHDGVVVNFTVDAGTGRLLTEKPVS